uniref:Major outer membrane porin n=2 Tax=Chlamydia pecorum TaxID=85991 RepID=B8QS88_9CHLA|nr:major outer membrane protein [Chlamydia pecorum]ACG80799.1 major outer membrane protein [Chlamydia pecorum]ACG80800.1 major outer membrane protein [Chlamydia pecorum]
MKKLLKSAFLSAAFFAGDASLHALPVGNPAEPSLLIDGTIWEGMPGDPCDPCATWCDAISLRVGFYGDYVFDRVLKTDVPKMFSMGTAPTSANNVPTTSNAKSDRDNPAYGKHMHDAEWFTNAGYIALNIWDRFDIFCSLGATSGYFKGNSASFNLIGLIGISGTQLQETMYPNASISNGVVELYTDTTFSWSIGARGALWECGCATLGAEFQYAQSKPRVQELNVLSNAAQFTVHRPKGYINKELPLPLTAGTDNASDVKNATINYHEWQVGAALSYRLNMLIPYIGVQWSRASFDADTIQIAQPKLAAPIFNMTTWNPTLLGEIRSTDLDTANKYADTLQIVSLQINKLKSRKACGVSMGATLIDADKWAINGELRLINERAAHLSAQCRF